MFKKTFILVLLLSLLVSSAALAEVTNRDMQLMGGVVVSNANDSFFFCPMEPGVTKHWGLYALSKANEGPIVEITDGYPARLVHADSQKVYFLGYTDANRTVHALYSIDIATGANEMLLSDIASAFVEDDDVFLYVTSSDPYTLHRYDIAKKASTKIKDMSASNKKIYDAVVYKNVVYFLTQTANGTENGYKMNDSGKANNLDEPSPKLYTGMLYEGYRIYANDSSGTRIFAVALGKKNGQELAKKYTPSLSSPRFGEALYVYDGDTNSLVRCPLDGSAETSLKLDGNATLTRLVMGGNAEEMYIWNNGAIYSVKADLSSQTRLFDFAQSTGGQILSYIAPARNNMMLLMGYGQETFTHYNNMMPTGVYAVDRSTGEIVFEYPALDSPEAQVTNNPGEAVIPAVLGDVPVEPKAEGESYFEF